MKIFPSENEKILAAVLMSGCLGMFAGIFGASKISDTSVLLPSLATLVAAFFGAWFAYKLQDRAKRREEEKEKVERSNDLLFSLFQKLNALKMFQFDFVEPSRNDPGQMISMQPVLDFKLPDSPIKAENINYLLKTKHKQLLFDAHIEDQRFEETEKVIRYRSHLHLNYIQPAMQAAGMIDGAEYTNVQIRAAVGDLLYAQLRKATEAVIYHVDRTIESSDNLREKLIAVIKEIFPNEPIIEFVLLEEPPNQSPQTDARTARG